MKKVLHHFHSTKKHIVAHVNKHHKKYIFTAGTTVGFGIFKIIAIVAVFFGITFLSGRTNANTEEIGLYKGLNSLYQINEIAQKNINASNNKEGYIFNETNMEFIKSLDEAFHDANNLNERYRATKEMVDFLTKRNKTKHIGRIITGLELEFIQLLPIFNQMQ